MTPADLITLRTRLGLTQAGLAKRVGVHPMTVSRWERGFSAVPGPVARLLEMLAATAASA